MGKNNFLCLMLLMVSLGLLMPCIARAQSAGEFGSGSTGISTGLPGANGRSPEILLDETTGKSPGTNRKSPGTNRKLPGTNSELPGTKGELQGTNSKSPGTNSKSLGAKGELQGTKGELPGTKGELPGTKDELPTEDESPGIKQSELLRQEGLIRGGNVQPAPAPILQKPPLIDVKPL